jgi:epoxyqueuosine reductase QueG/putative sterol carrier protein
MRLDGHPTVLAVGGRSCVSVPGSGELLDAGWLRKVCLAAGADDAGCVAIDDPAVANQRETILEAFPRTRTLVSHVCRLHPESLRSPARSLAQQEFNRGTRRIDEVGRAIAVALGAAGVGALAVPATFPMEIERFPERQPWIVGHKPVAVAAGLGRMGRNRLVAHPRFGVFMVLGTVLVAAGVGAYGRPLDFDPCLRCQACVAVCPVGAIGRDGRFDFAACYANCYRYSLTGFGDWVERLADSPNRLAYRRRVSDGETSGVWQALTVGPIYRTGYCLAVCPAGEEVIRPFLDDRARFMAEVVRPLREKRENVYVVAGSDAEAYAAAHFPHKPLRRVDNGLRAQSVESFLSGAPLKFQSRRAAGLVVTVHFTFTGGREARRVTMAIRDGNLTVAEGHTDTADVRVRADGATWLGILAKERSLVGAVLRGKVRVSGKVGLLRAFGRCFV